MNDPSIIRNNKIKNNDIGRDLNLGCNIYKLPVKQSTFQNLIESSKTLSREDNEYKIMLQELSDYFNPRPGRTIYGLEAKLNDGKRKDLLEDAEFLEHKFSRMVAAGQFSKTEEIIYYHCLSTINSAFSTYIKPQFELNADNQIIDRLLYEKIVVPIHKEISTVTITISQDIIRGMIFFLTGKCHLKWSGQ